MTDEDRKYLRYLPWIHVGVWILVGNAVAHLFHS